MLLRRRGASVDSLSTQFCFIAATVYRRRTKSLGNVLYRLSTNCIRHMYSSLNNAMMIALLLDVNHTTILRCLTSTERNKYMRSGPKPDILKACLQSVIENDQLINLREANASIVATTGVSVSQQLIRVILKTPGSNRNKVLVHSRPASTEIAGTAFLERRDRYEAQEHQFVFSLDETCFKRDNRSADEYLLSGSPLHVRSKS